MTTPGSLLKRLVSALLGDGAPRRMGIFPLEAEVRGVLDAYPLLADTGPVTDQTVRLDASAGAILEHRVPGESEG